MALTNPDKVVTEERLNEYHRTILPYLGGNSMLACGGGYAPIGTVISYMGTRAPSDFLICDGTVYNIADYTELADFFEAQFGSSNFFGGDGNTTFAVPDLRGEFLRGTGTNSHANQGSGANVGVHQDATQHIWQGINMAVSGTNIWIQTSETRGTTDSLSADKFDTLIGSSNKIGHWYGPEGGTFTGAGDKYYTSRPTNTSVLYCIKAKSQGNGYSLDEQIVGTWIDGKPIYQKTYSNIALNGAVNTWITISDIPVSNIDRLVDVKSIRQVDSTVNNLVFCVYNGAFRFMFVSTDFPGDYYITLYYTKNTD